MPRAKTKLRCADYAVVEEAASKGCSERSIAQVIGMSYGSWCRAKKADAKARAALARGRAQEHDALVGALYRAATEKGHVVAAIFLLKARHGYTDQPQPQLPESRVEVTFQLPAALQPEQYQRLVDVTPRRALEEAGVDAN